MRFVKTELVTLLCAVQVHVMQSTIKVAKCHFDDTVDLTNEQKFSNGSYLYENRIIPSEQVANYEYIVTVDGEQRSHAPHPRACVCHEKNCIQFCCDPRKETLSRSGQCVPLRERINYDHQLLKDFIVVKGMTYADAYPLTPELTEKDDWEILENGGFMSMVFMAMVVIIIYLCKALIRTIPFFCLVCYLLSVIIGNTILCLIAFTEVVLSKLMCSLVGYTAYLFHESSFIWLAILAYEIWRSLCSPEKTNISAKKLRLKYAVLGFGIPVCFTIALIVIQNSNIDNELKPGVGDEYCWIDVHRGSAMYYFIGLNSLMILCTFIILYLSLRQSSNERQYKELALNPDVNTSIIESPTMDVYSFVRFVLLMTITNLCQTKDSFKCDFHDTIDLTNAFRYDDKYFFKNHMFSPEVVEVYDYEETLDGHLVDREPHPRACFCNVQFCMKYCCNPRGEWLSPDGRHCHKFNSPLLYNAKVKVLLDNGYIESHNVEDNFIITQGKVCENSKVVKPITVNWHIMENGSLLLADDKGSMVPRRDFCLMTLRTETDDDDEDDKQWFLEPFVCSEPDVNDGDTYTYNPNKEGTGLIGIISTPFILMTVVFHMVRPEHKNLRGKCLILCLASMAIGNTLLSAVSLSGALYPRVLCQTMGVMAYLFLESSFIWLTIIGYDMWRNSKTFIAIFNERKRFFKYLEYGCGIPLVLTTVLIFLRRIDLPDIYTPNMDREYCWWISYDWAGVLYYFGLNAFILLINFLFSALTLWKELPYMRKCEELRRYIDMVERSLCLYSLLFAIMASCFAFKMYVFMSDLLERNTSPVTVYIAESVSITEGPLIFFVLVLMPLSKRRWQGSSASITELEESLQRADTMESTYQAPIVITSQLK